MSGKITLVPINKGQVTNRTAFNIDDDAFPVLQNSYQWRGRVKRKRGTSLLGRLNRLLTIPTTPLISGSLTLPIPSGGLIVPGSINLVSNGKTYTDPNKNGTLSGTSGGTGTINYSTSVITITGGGTDDISGTLSYYPNLPVLGLEDVVINTTDLPTTMGFDTTYSYNISSASPYPIKDVSFYKNPPDGTYDGYTAKITLTPLTWNSQTYQQVFSVNYQGAFWATNGVTVPFTKTNIGMQYKPITNVSITGGSGPAKADITITAHGLVIGDFIFVNEVVGIDGINFQTGYVDGVHTVDSIGVVFPNATLTGSYSSGGIAQYLTNRSDPTKDGIRWYDGDPTQFPYGWVNFAPPLSQSPFIIDDNPEAQYYLVGCKCMAVFKDRILFIGPVIQTSVANSQIYLQDSVVYSQNGTPYYTSSFTGDVDSSATQFFPILTPSNPNVQTSAPSSYFGDQTGFGGYITAGVQQPINTVSSNEDVLILGFSKIQTRFVYTGNDVLPFNFFIINSELGASSTFSAVNLDRGVISVGDHGISITSQVGAERVDLQIPDSIFEFNLINNGPERICAQRDFINEWIYFTYSNNQNSYRYPNQTLQYNYRDDSWAVFLENYTTYGTFRRRTGYTWATIGSVFPTWSVWNESWNSGSSTLLQPEVIAGNQQGFIMFRDVGTGEANSLYIESFTSSVVTSPSHGLNSGDYIVINNALGTVGTLVNGQIFQVGVQSEDTFVLNPSLPSGLTYLGLGTIQRMYIPLIQTKQFPSAWELGRKTRIGVQQYLFSTTPNGQVTVNIYLSQNGTNAWNSISENPPPNSLVYSQVVYTCPESTNLGLTSANSNLQMPTASAQQQIWHRMNTSMIGDTIQVGVTLSDAQMRDPAFKNQFVEIELHGLIMNISPSQMLS